MHSILHSFRPPLPVLAMRSEEWRSQRRSRAIATLIGIAVLSAAVSVVCLWQANKEMNRWRLSNESRGWPSATGEIIDTKLHRSGGRGSSESAAVRYRFLVGKKMFEGQTIAFHSVRSDAAETAVRRYRPGTAVRVFFRSSDPVLSVLETGSWTGWPVVGALALAGMGAAFFTIALLRTSARISAGARPA